ncbi:MAG: alpha/beta hydrolase [Terrimicrobiaceae bacterium]|nr:alpha/beta hydrolase [Terrimicrobiaceae bacterium]
MISFLRWSGRALFALLVIAFLVCAGVIVKFERWKKDRLAWLDAGSKVVRTAAGDVEYTERGVGPAVLICHGAPGGYDQAMLLGEALAKNGFRVIAPSRPGFLRTPLTTGLLFDDQADALAALLDKLGVARASVLGFSTGSQVAARFALRHPDRTDALVLISPVIAAYQRDPATQPRQILPDAALFKTTGDMGAWFFVKQARRDPRWMLDAVFATDTNLDDRARSALVDFVMRDPAQLAFFRHLVGTQAPLSPRESGTRNDLLLVRALDPVAYEKIQAPTLLVAGSADSGSLWVDLKAITSRLPAAKVVTVGDAGHLVWFGPNSAAAQQAVGDFLRHPPLVPAPSATPAPAPAAN